METKTRLCRERKIDAMHKLFGVCEGKTCKECSNFLAGECGNHRVKKCAVYGLTHSEATDWAGKWPACGLFGKEYTGRPVVRALASMPRGNAPAEQIEGQMEF